MASIVLKFFLGLNKLMIVSGYFQEAWESTFYFSASNQFYLSRKFETNRAGRKQIQAYYTWRRRQTNSIKICLETGYKMILYLKCVKRLQPQCILS